MSLETQKLDEEKFNAAWKQYHYALEFAYVNEKFFRIYASKSPTSLEDRDCRFKYSVKFVQTGCIGGKMMGWCELDENLNNIGKTYWTALADWVDLKTTAEKHFAKLLDLWGQKYSALCTSGKLEVEEFSDAEATRNLKSEYSTKKVFLSEPTGSTIFYHRVESFGKKPTFHEYPNFGYAPFNPQNIDLSQLSMPGLHISIGDQTEEEIFDLIEDWRRGMVKDKFEWIKWRLVGSQFDRRKLMNLLNGEFNESGGPIEIKQYKKHGRVGRLYHNETELRFICDKPMSRSKKAKIIINSIFQKVINFPQILLKSKIEKNLKSLGEIINEGFEENI